MDAIDEIKKKLGTGKLIIGTDNTIKSVKTGKAKKVFLAKNCPTDVKKSLERYSKLAGAELVQLEISNDEVGVVCKKQFSISVMCLVE